VNATTANSPIKLNYDSSPVDSILFSRARTSNSPVTIRHHIAFEGTISVQSTLFPPVIEQNDAEDPSGKGRPRSVEIVKVATGIRMGAVYWDKKKEVTGSTEITSTNSPIHLQV
jgi:hypothetical protein